MVVRLGVLPFVFSSFLAIPAVAQPAADSAGLVVPLRVSANTPLRLYLTGRVSKKIGAPVEAKLLEPVFAFDREVIPAGTAAHGEVVRTQPVSRWQRLTAILNGDFTPLRQARVEFTSLKMPNGQTLAVRTADSTGLNSIYIEPSKKKKTKTNSTSHSPNGGILGTAKATVRDRVNASINARSRGTAEILRGPNKKERLIDFLWSKAPYHPQYWRRGTRFDASLRDPLEFGVVPVKPADLAALGTQPAADSVAHVRLLTSLSSATAKQGEAVEAVVATPLFSPAHQLVLPEGTRLTGVVVFSRKARRFHRPGQLRFAFQRVDLPREVANRRIAVSMKTTASLQAAESGGKAPIDVDSEGGVRAKESKTRFLAPLISVMLASRAADNDAGHHNATGTGAGNGNVSGRTLGGGLGFGLAGAAVSQSSKYVGMAFGYYGLAWSTYSALIGRGGEVEFGENAMMEVKFGGRPSGLHFLAAVRESSQSSPTSR